MTARAHVTLRIAAVVWIAALVLLPRWGASSSQPAADSPEAPAPAATRAHTLAETPHGAAIAKM